MHWKQKFKRYKSTFWFFFVIIVVTGAYWWFYKSPYFSLALDWTRQNMVLFSLTILVLKTIGIVFPPVPGGTITIGAIPFFGWELAYLIDLAGSMIGAVISYHLGKKYGYTLINKLFDKDVVEKIKKAKIKKNREIEAIFVYRVLLGGTILEAIYYGAGVLKVGFVNFMIGSFLSHLVVGIPIFYLTKNIISGESILIIAISLIIVIILFSKLKSRYFE